MKITSTIIYVLAVILSINNRLYSFENRIGKEIVLQGYERSYTIVLPSNYNQLQKYPAIIALHGGGGSGQQCEKSYALTNWANKNGYIMVYPDGVKKKGLIKLRTWNAGTCCGNASENNVNDVEFISLILDDLVKNYFSDSEKIFVVGMSNGGMMAYKLACEIPNKIRGIAVVSGTMVTNKIYNNLIPVPILHIHSINDKRVPVKGGKGVSDYYFPSVDSVLSIWKKINKCDENNKQILKGIDFTNYKWYNDKGDLMIDYYLTEDGGHSWPQGKKGSIFSDKPAISINANDLIFYFFNTLCNRK